MIGPFTGKLSLERFYGFNGRIIKVVDRYLREKYY